MQLIKTIVSCKDHRMLGNSNCLLVYHVSPATSFLFLNFLEFLIRFILSPRTPRRALGCSGKQCAHRTHTWHSKHMRMCTRACTHTTEPPTYAHEHARFQVQVSTCTDACTKTRLHSRMRAHMDIRINTPSPVSARPRMHLAHISRGQPCPPSPTPSSEVQPRPAHHPRAPSPPSLSQHPRSFPTSAATTAFSVAFGERVSSTRIRHGHACFCCRLWIALHASPGAGCEQAIRKSFIHDDFGRFILN